MKQNAIKPPIIIPSLRFRADILPMIVLIPGTWLAASVMRRLMLASVSRWRLKLSLTAYAWLKILSVMLLLLSMRLRSSSMYSASAASGLLARYWLMSSRTLERRFARSRAVWRVERSRVKSRLCAESFSRSSERLFCLRADDVSVDSLSSSLANWAIVDSRWDKQLC